MKIKTIVVTGASKGIGKALAAKLAKKNINLVLAARSTENLKELTEKLKPLCNECIYLRLDLSQESNIIKFFSEIQKKYKKIDILINNAGIGSYSLIKDIELKKAKELFDVNFFGLVLCCKEVLKKQMIKRNGKIVNIASEVSFRGIPTTSIYCASKSAVKSFSESLKLEVRKLGINILVFYPGYTNTEFHNYANNNSTLKKPIRKGISTNDVANYIIKRMKKGNFENIPYKNGKILKFLNTLFPVSVDYLLYKKYNKKYL